MRRLLLLALAASAAATPIMAGGRSPRFAEYPVAVMTSPPAPLKLSSDDLTYRTRLRDLHRSAPNFAGHYAIAEVGCGTSCAFLLVVDLRTGKSAFFDVPSGEDLFVCDDAFADANGNVPGQQHDKFHYRANSRLFVVTGKMPGNSCGARYFVEKGGTMTRILDLPARARR